MSEYLTYTLWRQREERMPHELERQRVVNERLNEERAEQAAELNTQQAEQPAAPAARQRNVSGSVENSAGVQVEGPDFETEAELVHR